MSGPQTQWTETMDSDLKEMFYDGLFHAEIAKKLGTSVSSVRRRLYKFQLFVKGSEKTTSYIREPWTPGSPKPNFTLADPYTEAA